MSANATGAMEAAYELLQENEFDMAPMPSDETQVRWRNTAQWARLGLRGEGFLKADSPRGIWEVSEEGRRYLAQQEKGSV